MKKSKLIAPIIVSVLLCLYYLAFIIVCFIITVPLIIKLLFALIPAALFGVVIYVLVQRINEIRSGEENDIGQY